MEQQTTQVLVVDDNPEIRDIIHVLLEGEGIRVTEAADGSSALHFLEKGSFDLIILDIMMPGLNGYETCQKIRQLTNVPILFLSARTSDSDKLMGFSSGGDDYLAKPFSYTELLGRTRALIRRYRIYQGKSPTARQSASNLFLRRSVPGSPVGKSNSEGSAGNSHLHRVPDPEATAFQPQTDFLSPAAL